MAEERRIVTILFADVAGSTALGETLDLEDIRAFLERYFAIAKDVVAEHGGTLAKFIGDAVMAVFGLPQAHGDDAARALSAALSLRDRVRADPVLGERVPIRLGLNTGEIIAPRDGTSVEFLVAGDAVNVAARLQQSAESWTILCSERTARAGGAAFSFGPLVTVDAKGKRAPVRAAPLLGRAPSMGSRRTPLIGRDADLAQLDLVARRAFAERRPFLVSIIAPAGTGKTRLVEEFLERLPGLGTRVTMAIGQCLPYGQRLTYWPLRAILFSLIGVGEDARPEIAREAIRSWLQGSGIEEPARVAEILAATVGVGECEISDRTILQSAWRTAIELASHRSPLVLVFEDLHWSSDSLLDLVESMMQPRGDAAVLAITLMRPELLDRRPGWGGGRRNYVSLSLEPLSDSQIAALVGHLMAAPLTEAVDRIVERAGGNPFYAGELVRSLLERVGTFPDHEKVDRALELLPDTVQATVLARLDLLGSDERRVLQLGTIFGRAFRTSSIAALAPELGGNAERIVDVLISKDLVRPYDGEGVVFRHILIREVAYQSLPRSERARLHAAAGAWLAEHAAGREESLAELIAFHYREAATLGRTIGVDPNTAAAIRHNAARWLARAADTAAAAAASLEAARHLRAAIELADPGALPELYERLGDVDLAGNSVAAYREALRLCRQTDRSPDQELRVLASLLTLYTRFQSAIADRPSDEEMTRLLAAGETLLSRTQDRRAIAGFLIAKGFFAYWRRPPVTSPEFAEWEASARRGLEIAEQLDDPKLCSAGLDALSVCAQMRGSWKQSRAFAQQRLGLQDRLDLMERLDTHSMIAWGSALLGDLDEAIQTSAAGLALVQPGQVPNWALHLAAWRIYALALRGRWNDATDAAERARRLWEDTNRLAAGNAVRGFIAALDVARGQKNTVLVKRHLEVLDAILTNFKHHPFYGRFLPFLGPDFDALDAQVVRAFRAEHVGTEFLERALSLCVDHGRATSPKLARGIADFAEIHHYAVLEAQARRALGQASSAAAEFSRALAIFERIGAAPYAARVRCERALLTGDEVEFATGMRALEEIGDLDQLHRFEQVHSHGRAP